MIVLELGLKDHTCGEPTDDLIGIAFDGGVLLLA
jgi:hypothetical protein